MRLTTTEHGEHHVTVPAHGALRVGTLAGVLGDVAEHFELTGVEFGPPALRLGVSAATEDATYTPAHATKRDKRRGRHSRAGGITNSRQAGWLGLR
jgi:hypothetical protein